MATRFAGGLTAEERPELSREEGRKLFDSAAKRLMGVSGDVFLARWDHGEYKGMDTRALTTLAMLIPFGRPNAV